MNNKFIIVLATLALVGTNGLHLVQAGLIDDLQNRIGSATGSITRRIPSMNTPSVPRPRMPESLPDMPNMPNMPDMPDMPNMPNMPGMPGMEDMTRQLGSIENQMRGMMPGMPRNVRGQMNDLMNRIREMNPMNMPDMRMPGMEDMTRQLGSIENQMRGMMPGMPRNVRGQMNDLMKRIRDMITRGMMPDLPAMPGIPRAPKPLANMI